MKKGLKEWFFDILRVFGGREDKAQSVTRRCVESDTRMQPVSNNEWLDAMRGAW